MEGTQIRQIWAVKPPIWGRGDLPYVPPNLGGGSALHTPNFGEGLLPANRVFSPGAARGGGAGQGRTPRGDGGGQRGDRFGDPPPVLGAPHRRGVHGVSDPQCPSSGLRTAGAGTLKSIPGPSKPTLRSQNMSWGSPKCSLGSLKPHAGTPQPQPR